MRREFLSVGGLAAVAALGMLFIAPKEPAPEITENTWIGKLVDWDCKQIRVDEPCPVNAETKSFGVSVNGGILLDLDERGDVLARERLRDAGRGGNVEVIIVGVRDGYDLAVESLELAPPPEPPISD